MAYDIALIIGGVRTEILVDAASASVETVTEGLDTLDVDITWDLLALREDPSYDIIKYVWPGPMSRLELVRQDTGAVVFNGQVHAVSADRDNNSFTLGAQS